MTTKTNSKRWTMIIIAIILAICVIGAIFSISIMIQSKSPPKSAPVINSPDTAKPVQDKKAPEENNKTSPSNPSPEKVDKGKCPFGFDQKNKNKGKGKRVRFDIDEEGDKPHQRLEEEGHLLEKKMN